VESIPGTDSVATAVAKMGQLRVLSLPVTTPLSTKANDPPRNLYVGFISMWDVVNAVWARIAKSDEVKEEAAVEQVLEGSVKDLLKEAAERSMFSPMSFLYASSITLGHLLDSFSAQRGLHRVLLQTGGHHVVVSQSDAVRILVDYTEEEQQVSPESATLLPVMLQSLRQLGFTGSDVVKMRPSDPSTNALRLMSVNNVQAVAVVDDKGVLLGTFSASDLRGLDVKTIISSLRLPAKDFLRLSASSQFTCSLDDSLLNVATKMARNKVFTLLHMFSLSLSSLSSPCHVSPFSFAGPSPVDM